MTGNIMGPFMKSWAIHGVIHGVESALQLHCRKSLELQMWKPLIDTLGITFWLAPTTRRIIALGQHKSCALHAVCVPIFSGGGFIL